MKISSDLILKIIEVTILIMVIYFLSPVLLPLVKSPVVYPNLFFDECPEGYHYNTDYMFRPIKGKCFRNLKTCEPGAIWTLKLGDCSPGMAGCHYDEPCRCKRNWATKNGGYVDSSYVCKERK